MRDSVAEMTEQAHPPQSWKLEREATLMPSEFRQRLSAHQRKSRIARSAGSSQVSKPSKRETSSRQPTATLRYHTEMSSINLPNYKPQFTDEPSSPISNKTFVMKVDKMSKLHAGDTSVNDTASVSDTSAGELQGTSSHIQLNGEVKYMLENAYSNYESEGGLSVKTPPQNLHIKDLMLPLDDWNSPREKIIREKKYTVLPSIHGSPTTEYSDHNTARNSVSSSFSMNAGNQLDFFRDKIEEEADFFADYRVNTSHIKATPRQDPLPPIKHGTGDQITMQNGTRTNKKTSKPKLHTKPLLL